MKIGLYISPSQNSIYHDSIEQAVLADQLGYTSVWLTEKHFDQGYQLWSSPLITASYIAAKTQNIKIGFAACISTLHHPVRLAEDFANLDMLSHGRLIIGLTRTSLSNHYHEVFQSPVKKTWKKFDEQFEIMQKLWQDNLSSYSGSFYKIPATKLYPPLVQKPIPPIFFIAGNNESIIAAARKGVGIFLHTFQDLKTIKIKKKLYEDHFVDVFKLGPQVILSRYLYCGISNQEAKNDIETPFIRNIETQFPKLIVSLENEYKMSIDFNFFDQECCLFGSADSCVEKINTITAETGINNYTFIFNFVTLSHHLCINSMKRFALGALPKLKNKCPSKMTV